jgi:hypothetical protein
MRCEWAKMSQSPQSSALRWERATLFWNIKEWVRAFGPDSTGGNPLTPTLFQNGERERTEFAARSTGTFNT